jgi:hypothetical protein
MCMGSLKSSSLPSFSHSNAQSNDCFSVYSTCNTIFSDKSRYGEVHNQYGRKIWQHFKFISDRRLVFFDSLRGSEWSRVGAPRTLELDPIHASCQVFSFLMLEIVQSLWNVRSFVVKCSESFWMCLMFDVSFWIGGNRVECSWHFQLGYESCRIRPSSHEPWWHLLDCQHILKYETEEKAEF